MINEPMATIQTDISHGSSNHLSDVLLKEHIFFVLTKRNVWVESEKENIDIQRNSKKKLLKHRSTYPESNRMVAEFVLLSVISNYYLVLIYELYSIFVILTLLKLEKKSSLLSQHVSSWIHNTFSDGFCLKCLCSKLSHTTILHTKSTNLQNLLKVFVNSLQHLAVHTNSGNPREFCMSSNNFNATLTNHSAPPCYWYNSMILLPCSWLLTCRRAN